MTKKPKPEHTPALPETAPDPDTDPKQEAPTFSKADVAKAIRVQVTVSDATDGKRTVTTRKAGADDIVDFRIDGDTVHAVTCDGRKHSGTIA